MNSVAYIVELCEGLYISHDMILTGNRNSKNAENRILREMQVLWI